ncbi:hypothetical protein E3J79_01890 [Candidatus Dependentiae bacterium]|nr:MAG: hypothetical protein E3J79_01890 [Candidatus Dependentiae bacterium]
MLKKILTLSSIAFLLACTYLNGEQFKLENKSNKPIFIRFFATLKNGTVPPLNNFSLTKLAENGKIKHRYLGKFYLCISFADPAFNDKLEVKFIKITPEDKIFNFEVLNETYYSLNNLLSFLHLQPIQTNWKIANNWFLKKNEEGKWQLAKPKENLPKKEVKEKPISEKKPIIQMPTIIEDQPLPQTIRVFE